MRAFCALAVLLIVALAGPAVAGAAPATEEYDLALPEADGGDSADSSDDESGAAIAPPTSAPPTAPAPETVAPPAAADPGQGGDDQGDDGAGGQPDDGLFASPAPDEPVENFTTSGSGEGGFPALLLLLGAIAGICAGFVIWRMRRSNGDSGRGPASPAGRDMTSGTQSP